MSNKSTEVNICGVGRLHVSLEEVPLGTFFKLENGDETYMKIGNIEAWCFNRSVIFLVRDYQSIRVINEVELKIISMAVI